MFAIRIPGEVVGRFESTPFAGETAAAANGVESTAGVTRTALSDQDKLVNGGSRLYLLKVSKCLDTNCGWKVRVIRGESTAGVTRTALSEQMPRQQVSKCLDTR